MKYFFLLPLTILQLSYGQCMVQDDAGQKLILNTPATRIISLAPDITENLFAIGAGENIVGVIAGSDFPAKAQFKALVGSYSGLDLEKMISLKPDLVVTWSNSFPRQISILRNLHIPIYVVAPVQLEDVPRTLNNLGCLTNHRQKASAIANRFSQQLLQLKSRYQNSKPHKVFYQLGPYSLMTLNKKSWVNQAISLCGGKNIFADLPMITPEVTWEALIIANPDIIIADSEHNNWQQKWRQWPMIAAVKNNRLFNVQPDLIERAGPRLIDGVKTLCGLING